MKTTLDKPRPTPSTRMRDLKESPLPDLTPEQQAMADEVAAAVADQREQHRQRPISLEKARAQVPEDLRARSPLNSG